MYVTATQDTAHDAEHRTQTVVPDSGGDDGCGLLASYKIQSPDDDGRFHETTSDIALMKSMTVGKPSVFNDNSVPITLCKHIHCN